MSIAYVLVQCLIGREMEVLRSLLEINFVKESKGTFGYYDILVKIEAPSEKQIENVVSVSFEYSIPCISLVCFPNSSATFSISPSTE